GNFSHWEPYLLVKRYFGTLARTYRLGWYTIMVWNRNLLKALPTDDPFGTGPRSVRQRPVRPGPLGPVHPSLQDVTEHREQPGRGHGQQPGPHLRQGWRGRPSSTITAIR